MPRTMCDECPFRSGTRLNRFKDDVLPLIDDMVQTGELAGPHACHKTGKMHPDNPEEVCAGHQAHLRQLTRTA